MSVRVESEIGPLRRVLINRPKIEIDWMVPSHMQAHLFDDILDGETARREHDGFRALLESAGVEALDARTLLGEALASEKAKADLLRALREEYRVRERVLARLEPLEGPKLAEVAVGGLREADLAPEEGLAFDLTPVPNYLFQRDPQIVLGDRVIFSSMATDIREREPLLSRILFSHHPALAGSNGTFTVSPPLAHHRDSALTAHPTLEGGDVLIANRETLLVGLSHRSNRRGIERLAEYLRSEDTSFRHLLIVDLPPIRSYMHLDTVFTLVDEGSCLAFAPVITGPDASVVYRVDLTADELVFSRRDGLLPALAELGTELELIPCGGSGDRIHQEREQWTDGANAFAVAPGVIFLYHRNRHTAAELDRRGWRVLAEEEVLEGGASLLGGGPTAVTIRGNELSRARGGPRCMTMPIERDAVSS